MNEELANKMFEQINQLQEAAKITAVRTDLLTHLLGYAVIISQADPETLIEQLQLIEPTSEMPGLREMLKNEKQHIATELRKVIAVRDKVVRSLTDQP
jgi:hypothetical protein